MAAVMRSQLFLLSLLILLAVSACQQSVPGRNEIRIGLAQAPMSLDPRYATDAASHRIQELLHRGLVRLIGACANASARRYGLDARYEPVNLFEPFDLSGFCGADVLILDPPRKGAKRICRSMGALLPSRIIMVNCDAASGARDAAELRQLGYHLRALRAFDLFPYTDHVEAMSLWQR